MKLYYYDRERNFGDALNQWLWERLLPGCWDPDDGVYFAGIGTIINFAMPEARRWIVFTSGVGYGNPPPYFGDARWSVVSLRGPLSAAVLGLPSELAVTDGAVLLATLPEYSPLAEAQRRGVVFVPHHTADHAGGWAEVCRRAGVEYLSPILESRQVIGRLRSAKLVLADAMHAAIIADAFRVPWVPLVSSPQISTFKWLDWTRSLELPYNPVKLPPNSVVSKLRHRMLWAYNHRNLFSGNDDQAALLYFRRRYARDPPPLWVKAMWLGRRLHARADRFLKMPRLANWLHERDEALLDEAAAALEVAAQSAGVLSKHRVLADRLDALTFRLDKIRSLAT